MPEIPNRPAAPDWTHAGGGALVAPEVSRRVRAILDGVEREAGQLRADAREEARSYLEQARSYIDGLVSERQERIAALSEEIITRTEDVLGRLDEAAPVREGFENLVRSLGNAAERLAVEVEEMHLGTSITPPYWHAAPGGSPAQWAPQPGPEPAPYAGPVLPPGGPQHVPQPRPTPDYGSPAAAAPGVADGARAIAMQMASAGNTRAQIADYLRDHIGVSDSKPLLDELFGPGSADDARVPWTG